jgi:tetratricopeptide (TPR) repeat protein
LEKDPSSDTTAMTTSADGGNDAESSPLRQQQQQEAASAAFHEDMRRVLAVRKDALQQHGYASSVAERRFPVVLDSDVDGAERVLVMLRRLESLKKDAVTETSYQIVMRAFAARGRFRWMKSDTGSTIICAADQLEELLDDLLQRVPGTSVSMETYELVLQTYAVCATPRGERNYAEKADALLHRLEAMFGTVPVSALQQVLHAYAWQQANLQEGDCAERADDLLQQIIEKTNDPAVLMQAYALVIEAWSKSGKAGSADKADALFSSMKALNSTLTERDVDSCRLLDAEVYSNAILAWSKTPPEAGAAQKAHERLTEMLERYEAGAFPSGSEPPLIAFNGVISAWRRAGRPDNAEEVLWLMDKVRPTCTQLVPNSVSYNSVLHGYLRIPDKTEALERALKLVEYMEHNCDTQPAIRPNCFSYNTLMKCWIQSGASDLAEQAERMLIKMERRWERGDNSLPASNRIFNMVINAYAKSSHPRAAQKACDLLERMKQQNDEPCKPDIISYTSAIECISKSADPGAPAKAEALLEEASRLYRETGDPKMMPNLRTYTMAIQTLAKNNGSVVKARALLTQLLDQYEKEKDPQLYPNTYPFNYVLNCAANCLDNKLEAFQIATQTYQEMRKSDLVRPDSFSYAFWLKCCNNLLAPGDLRTKCISYAFEECKRDGLVSDEVLTRLFQGSPPLLVGQLLELSDHSRRPYRSMKVNDLPRAWSRNCSKGRYDR